MKLAVAFNFERSALRHSLNLWFAPVLQWSLIDMADRSLPSAEIIQIRDYQNHDELRERGLRAVASALGVEMVDDDLINANEPIYFSDDGDCA